MILCGLSIEHLYSPQSSSFEEDIGITRAYLRPKESVSGEGKLMSAGNGERSKSSDPEELTESVIRAKVSSRSDEAVLNSKL